MNTPEQLKQAMAEAAKQHKAYDENSVPKARTAWLDARDRLQALEASGASMDAIYEARQAVSDREKELETATHFAGHYAAAAQYRNHQAQVEQAAKVEQEQAQKQHAAEEKAKYREEAKKLYLASGGTEDQFNHAFPDMWLRELDRRTQSDHDSMTERLKARYAGMQV